MKLGSAWSLTGIPRRVQGALVVVLLCVGAAALYGATHRTAANQAAGQVESFRRPNRGQVVVVNLRGLSSCRRFGGTAVARVMGLPLETVGVSRGRLFVNGHLSRLRPYFFDSRVTVTNRTVDLPAQHIPKGQYLLLGAAANPSCDSRYFGPFPGYLLRPLAIPRLAQATPYNQGFESCSTYGLGELEALYGLKDRQSVAAAVSRDQPSPNKNLVYQGCLTGLPNHHEGSVKAKPPAHFIDPDLSPSK